LDVGDLDDLGASSPSGESAPSASEPKRRLRILVVEDDDDARIALRMLLELQGYAVSEAAEGAGGVALALADRPDVVVIDIGLPGLDGYGVARRIRDGLAGASMYLIALTGYQEIEERGHAAAKGFDAHLVKPLKFDQLVELLERGSIVRPAAIGIDSSP
jgi:CheY-like chemotaxis protein